MKHVLFALLTLVMTSSAFASQPEVHCSSSFGRQGPKIFGYSLVIHQNEDRPGYTGTLFLNCPVCLVEPTYLQFDHKIQEEETLMYLGPVPRSGPADKLMISVESGLPTRTFPARLITQKLNKGNPVDFTCQF